jgi:iron complex transport system substrate-binding protein
MFHYFSGTTLAPIAYSAPAASAPQRIVTLGAAVTETVFALGAGAQVVARDTSSTYPEATRALPDVGYFRTFGAEGVLALRPTLILAAHGAGPPEQLELLRASTIPLRHFNSPPGLDSTLALITETGAALQLDTEAAALAANLRAELASAAALRAGRPALRVLLLLGAPGGASVQAAGDRTAAAAFLALCGADNAAAGQPGYRTASAEGVIGLAPDVIFVGIDPSAPGHTLPDWLANTPAGLAGRVHSLPLSYLAFGPRLGGAVEATTRLLYPAVPAVAAR